MANRTIYTRVYSESSAGQLNSGRCPTGPPLSGDELLAEFRRHASLTNRIPTALVSVSSRIVDTIYRAFKKHYVDGESPADIWVVFIEAPAEGNGPPARLHSARELARSTGLEPKRFHYEFVFEWGIPQDHVLHKVSLKTLMDRGLRVDSEDLSTEALRISTAREFEQSSSYPVDIGINLGFFAQKFGARAPLDWIAHQWYFDSVRTWVDWSFHEVKLRYAHGRSETVTIDFFCDLDRGIDTVLSDWWLADSDFARDYEEFKRWREIMEDGMTWDLIEFWEIWHDEEEDRVPWDLLWAKNRDIQEVIEAEAVRIGL